MHKSRISQQNYATEKMTLFRWGNPLHSGGMIYGCAGVSTDGHIVGAQVEALAAAGIASTGQTIGQAQPCRSPDLSVSSSIPSFLSHDSNAVQ